MKASVKAAWLAALRSGKYKQGKDVLRSKDNCFCCLGVLADVCKVVWLPSLTFHYEFHYKGERNDLYFSPEFLYHIGLTDEEQSRLSMLNDSFRMGKSFNGIADEIEQNIVAEPD